MFLWLCQHSLHEDKLWKWLKLCIGGILLAQDGLHTTKSDSFHVHPNIWLIQCLLVFDILAKREITLLD